MPFKQFLQLTAFLCLLFQYVGVSASDSASAAHQSSVPMNVFLSETDVLDVSFQFIEDETAQASLWNIINRPDEDWTKVQSGGGNFGFSASAFWLRLDVKNGMKVPSKTLIAVNYPLLDFLDFYYVAGQSVVQSSLVGDMRPFSNRDLDHPNLVFRIAQNPGEVNRIYLRAESKGTIVFPLQVWQEKNFFEQTSKSNSFYLFYFGGMFIVVLLNLAIFSMLRERIYLYYSLANTGYIVFFGCTRGYTNQLFFPEYPEISSQLMLTALPVLALFSLLFARDFLKTKTQAPKLDVALKLMAGLELINLMGSFVLDYDLSIRFSTLLAAPFFGLLLIAGPIVWRTGSRVGALFTLAWALLTIGSFLQLFRFLGIVPDNFFTHYGMQIGSGAEAIVLMIALAYRIYDEREAKISAQKTSIEQAKQRRDSQEALVQAMLHDPVTKLPNRSLFEMAFNERIATDKDGDYMVILVRIERYVEISRTLGLSTGEALLKAVAQYYSEKIENLSGVVEIERINDRPLLLCNFSGDTFGVLLNRRDVITNPKPHFRFVEDLRKPFDFNGLSIDLHPKFGAARYPLHGENAELLIRNATVSIETNRNTLGVSFYSKEQDIYNESRLTLMSDLRRDLKMDLPELFYQPKLASNTGQVVGMEALIRWNHEKLGFIPPDEFIPLAEETGLISQLTRWVIRRALSDYLVFQQDGYDGDISINISARNLCEKDLPKFLSKTLLEFGITPSKVTLELTETAVMEDPELGIVALKALTDIGINLSIDDFGAGYSSLSYLKRLPATEIKLDRSLITDILNSESDRVIVQTSIDMAHNLGYDLVAEGVETEEVLDLLKSMRCDKMQGYHLSRPLNRDQMISWLEKTRLEADHPSAG